MVSPVQGEGSHTAENERDRLESLAATELLDTPAEEGFDRITRLAQQLFGVSTASVSLIADDRQFLKSVAGGLETNIARTDSFCTHTIATPEALIVEDARKDDRFRTNPLVLGQPNIRFYAGHPLQGPGGWNIGTLCIIDQEPRSFDPGQQQVLQDLAAVVQREINVRTDMKNAAKIQRALLPAAPPSLPGYDIQALHRPAGDLSGDFYDWHIRDARLRFTIADAMGKGTGPAILASRAQATLRAATQDDPGQDLAAVSHDLDANLDLSDAFVTAFHADLDPETGTVRYADAGHGLAHHVTADGGICRLTAGGPPLGVITGQDWPVRTLTLAPGEALIVPTDGVLELFKDDLSHLAGALQSMAAGRDAGHVLDRMTTGAGAKTDDVTLFMLRRSA